MSSLRTFLIKLRFDFLLVTLANGPAVTSHFTTTSLITLTTSVLSPSDTSPRSSLPLTPTLPWVEVDRTERRASMSLPPRWVNCELPHLLRMELSSRLASTLTTTLSRSTTLPTRPSSSPSTSSLRSTRRPRPPVSLPDLSFSVPSPTFPLSERAEMLPPTSSPSSSSTLFFLSTRSSSLN